MTVQQFVAIIFRFFSVWLLLIAFQFSMLAKFFSETFFKEHLAASKALIIIPVLVVVVAMLFWIFAMWFAKKILPFVDEGKTLDLNAKNFVAAGAVIMGLWSIINASPSVVSNLALIFMLQDQKFL